jgi:hypothetical protein
MLFLDFLLLLMIGVCIVYCWILSRRIHDLHNSRIEFARMIKELDASILKADSNIKEMAKLSEITVQEIKVSISEAETLLSSLRNVMSNANYMISQLKNSDISSKDFSNMIYRESENYAKDNKFTDEDFAPISQEDDEESNFDQEEKIAHENRMKGFIKHIVSKNKGSVDNDNMSAKTSYYDTLRKINVKK